MEEKACLLCFRQPPAKIGAFPYPDICEGSKTKPNNNTKKQQQWALRLHEHLAGLLSEAWGRCQWSLWHPEQYISAHNVERAKEWDGLLIPDERCLLLSQEHCWGAFGLVWDLQMCHFIHFSMAFTLVQKPYINHKCCIYYKQINHNQIFFQGQLNNFIFVGWFQKIGNILSEK